MTREDRELLRRLRRLRKRIPRFGGVLFDPKKRRYRAALKNGKSVKILGWHNTELAAFKQYAAENARLRSRNRIRPFEAPARIEKLLALAAQCPVPIRPESLLRSSLDLASNSLWGEAGGTRICRRALPHDAVE